MKGGRAMITEVQDSPTLAPAPLPSPPRRVLVVDDSRLQRRILAASLTRWGYDIRQAGSGEEALALCRRDPPDMVLSDWMMTGMDGPQFCRALRQLRQERYTYFILLTSLSEKDEVAQGLDSGADDFLSKPVNNGELRARLRAGERILRMQDELAEKTRVIGDTLAELRDLYDDIDRDLAQARRIQQALMPEKTLDCGAARISTLLKPCGHVGGDLVGIVRAGERRLGLYSIDVSGHGITSAMTAARVSSYLSTDFPEHNVALERRFARFYAMRPPEEVAMLLNRRLSIDAGISEYFTMAYATAELATGIVHLVQAGHPHPLLIHADGRLEPLGEGGLPVGLIPDARYRGLTIRLQPGDRLLLYSDGFTDCPLPGGARMGPDGFHALVRECLQTAQGGAFLDALYWRLAARAAPPDGPEDDVSAVLLEYQPG